MATDYIEINEEYVLKAAQETNDSLRSLGMPNGIDNKILKAQLTACILH